MYTAMLRIANHCNITLNKEMLPLLYLSGDLIQLNAPKPVEAPEIYQWCLFYIFMAF